MRTYLHWSAIGLLSIGVFFFSLVLSQEIIISGDQFPGIRVFSGRGEYTMQQISRNAFIGHPDGDAIVIEVSGKYPIETDDIVLGCSGDIHLTTLIRDMNGYRHIFSIEVDPEVDCSELSIRAGQSSEGLIIDRISYGKWMRVYLDAPSDALETRLQTILDQITTLGDAHKPNSPQESRFNTLTHESDLIGAILDAREAPEYLSPVAGVPIPVGHHKVPNTGRPYRASYTDGIHHGFDFDAPRGTPVRALGRGVIIYVEQDFVWEDFLRINYYPTTEFGRLLNLHVLRGNQVWLQTMSGDVFLYSHLANIPTDLNVGDIIEAGAYFGDIDSTGVPDHYYSDFHLHISHMVNPRTQNKIGKNTLLDIMGWDWYGRHNSYEWIQNNYETLFSADYLQ